MHRYIVDCHQAIAWMSTCMALTLETNEERQYKHIHSSASMSIWGEQFERCLKHILNQSNFRTCSYHFFQIMIFNYLITIFWILCFASFLTIFKRTFTTVKQLAERYIKIGASLTVRILERPNWEVTPHPIVTIFTPFPRLTGEEKGWGHFLILTFPNMALVTCILWKNKKALNENRNFAVMVINAMRVNLYSSQDLGSG